MPPSLRFASALIGAATLCAAASLSVLGLQARQQARVAAEQITGGRVDAGERAIRHYSCGACHVISGVDGADGRVGPSLDGIALRAEIAGQLSNQPANLIRWIRRPQHVDPGNGMPDLPIPEADARDVAAYLYTLKSD